MDLDLGLATYYTGIGSRATPEDVINLMVRIGEALSSENDYLLRSGGAPGADQAFETGGDSINEEIYIPWSGFEGYDENDDRVINVQSMPNYDRAFEIASQIHPYWHNCSRGARALHTRNVYEILGWSLDRPSDFVIYWAPLDKHGRITGGTATAVALAQENDVPTYNLNNPIVREDWETTLSETGDLMELMDRYLRTETGSPL